MQQPVRVPAVNSVIPILQPSWSPESLEMAGGICDYLGHSVLATAWAEVETFVSSFLALGAAGAAVASSGCSRRPACCGCQLSGTFRCAFAYELVVPRSSAGCSSQCSVRARQEPISSGNADGAAGAARLSGRQHEVVCSEASLLMPVLRVDKP